MKVLIAAVAFFAFASIAGVIYVGHRIAEPTVVADPYEAGLRYDQAHHEHDAAAVGPRAAPRCEPSRAACAQVVAGATVTLDVAPRPPRAMRDLELTVAVAPASAAGDGPARVALAMPGMYMGENRVALAAEGAGRWRGKGVVVRCPSGKRTWAAEVELPPRAAGERPLRATFTFDVAD